MAAIKQIASKPSTQSVGGPGQGASVSSAAGAFSASDGDTCQKTHSQEDASTGAHTTLQSIDERSVGQTFSGTHLVAVSSTTSIANATGSTASAGSQAEVQPQSQHIQGAQSQLLAQLQPQSQPQSQSQLQSQAQLQLLQSLQSMQMPKSQSGQQQQQQGVTYPAAFARVQRILHTLRESYPPIATSYDHVVDNLFYYRESWYEDIQKQLKQMQLKCWTVAFESRQALATLRAPLPYLTQLRRLLAQVADAYGRCCLTTRSAGTGTLTGTPSASALPAEQRPSSTDPFDCKFFPPFISDFVFAFTTFSFFELSFWIIHMLNFMTE